MTHLSFSYITYSNRNLKGNDMMNQTLCSCETETYLEQFHSILKTMVCEMTSAHLKDSISYNFIVQMIPHHEAAIQMSENILSYTKNCEIEKIARNIISTQKRSIENMCAIKDFCLRCRNYRNDLYHYQNALQPIFETMFADMRNAYSNNYVNCNFLREMIPHHEGAVRMSTLTLSCYICPELKPILLAIITEQKQGIQEMKQLLRQCPDDDCR